MNQPLQPKSEIRNTHPLTDRRLQAVGNGWSLIPCEKKASVPRGWPRMRNDAEAVEYHPIWQRFAGTGVLVKDRLAVLDSDITLPDLALKAMQLVYDAGEEAAATAILRKSGGETFAMFFQCGEPFGKKATHKYTPHPDRLDAWLTAKAMPMATLEQKIARVAALKSSWLALDAQHVEIYGPESQGRYFAYEGPHSPGRAYGCEPPELDPTTTRLDQLPLLPAEPGALIDQFDYLLADHLTVIPDTAPVTADVLYDLTPETVFICENGTEDTVESLAARLKPGAEHGQRGCMDWVSWAISKSKGNSNAFITNVQHRLCITDWSNNGVKHYLESDRAPAFDVSEELAGLLRQIATDSVSEPEAAPQEPPKPDLSKATLKQCVAWLLASFAHSEDGQVIRLYAAGAKCVQSMNDFHDHYAMFNVPKPKGDGCIYATRIWRQNIERQSVVSYDMRPDKPFPTYKEGGQLFKNTYLAPRHEGDGEIKTFRSFLRRLLPAWRERRYFYLWLAHKLVKPWLPMHSVIMVAVDEDGWQVELSGTGRGTLFKVLERLFGRHYVRNLDFTIVSGQSPQAIYTDWMADSLLVLVNESKEGPAKHGDRRSAYEHIKDKCDTGPRWMDVTGKNKPLRSSHIVCSYVIATNHADMFLMPRSDRRFVVLSNGMAMADSEIEAMFQWMDQPGNIAALARWLKALDMRAFNPMGRPLETPARERMMELGETDMSVLVREALETMKGIAFTRRQLELRVLNLAEDMEFIRSPAGQGQFAMVFKFARPLSKPGSKPRERRRIFDGTRQVRVYAGSRGDEWRCDKMSDYELKIEAEKNGLHAARNDGPVEGFRQD